jgi:hypothetical protein
MSRRTFTLPTPLITRLSGEELAAYNNTFKIMMVPSSALER